MRGLASLTINVVLTTRSQLLAVYFSEPTHWDRMDSAAALPATILERSELKHQRALSGELVQWNQAALCRN